MKNLPGSTEEIKAGSIMRTPVEVAWGRGLAIRDIVAHTNLSVAGVLKELKRIQKEIVERKENRHETENDF